MAKSRNQVLRRLKLRAEPQTAARLIPAPREDPEATSSTAVLLEQETAAVPVDEPTEELPEDQAEDENTADPEDQAPEDQAEDENTRGPGGPGT